MDIWFDNISLFSFIIIGEMSCTLLPLFFNPMIVLSTSMGVVGERKHELSIGGVRKLYTGGGVRPLVMVNDIEAKKLLIKFAKGNPYNRLSSTDKVKRVVDYHYSEWKWKWYI